VLELLRYTCATYCKTKDDLLMCLKTNVDASLKPGEGGFLLLNAATGEKVFDVRPQTRFYRVGRQKLRDLLSTGLDIRYGKKLESYQTTEDGEVVAKFKDGTATKGRMLIGADGSYSAVRTALMGESAHLTSLPIQLIGVVRHFTAEEIAPARTLNPLLFFATHPETNVFFVYSIQVRSSFP
jgi:2-polyprenyl-6-methoxyphenol hydroxylase-like FAD-dependent oxidoreductase